MPVGIGGALGYWLAEAEQGTATKPKYRQMLLELKKLMCVTYCTDELMADVTALGKVLTDAFTSEIAFKLDAAILNGTGAGCPLGILKSGALIQIPKEAGQAASTVCFENVAKIYARMLPRSRRNAVWIISPSVETSLYSMSLSVGTGGIPVYLPASGAAGQPNASLFGRPVIVTEQSPNLGSVGDILFADMQSYVLAEKGGIQTASSISLRFLEDEMAFRWVYRCDGQPIFSQPITPFNGGDTLSAFVALAVRA